MADQLLMQLEGSTFATNEWRPNEVYIYEDRIEELNPGFLGRSRTQTIRYEQVAQVALERGLKWSTLIIESRGGGVVRVKGVAKREADRAKALVDERVAATHAAHAPAAIAVGPQRGPADEIQRLAILRNEGVLTEDEFAAAKRKLLGIE